MTAVFKNRSITHAAEAPSEGRSLAGYACKCLSIKGLCLADKISSGSLELSRPCGIAGWSTPCGVAYRISPEEFHQNSYCVPEKVDII